MIKLNSIKVEGFKDPRRTVSLAFSKEPITVIYGNNGSGKSTLLKIIQAVLARNENILTEEKVSRIELTYSLHMDESESITKKASVWLESADVDSDSDTLHYNWEEFNKDELNELTSIFFGVQRGTSINPVNVNSGIIYQFIMKSGYSRNFHSRIITEEFADELANFISRDARIRRRSGRNDFSLDKQHLNFDIIDISNVEKLLIQRYREAKLVSSQRVQKALFDTLSLAINPQKKSTKEMQHLDDFLDVLEENKDRLIDALSSAAANTLRDQILNILINYDRDGFIKIHTPNQLLISLLDNMILELDSEKAILNSINILVDVFNDQVSGWKKLVVTQEESYVSILGENTHSLNDLSSGERHLLSFLSMFIIEGTRRNILIIDEPEISLNIKWQRELLPMLSKLAPMSQIIVASHSASISRKNTNYLVELTDNFNFYEVDDSDAVSENIEVKKSE